MTVCHLSDDYYAFFLHALIIKASVHCNFLVIRLCFFTEVFDAAFIIPIIIWFSFAFKVCNEALMNIWQFGVISLMINTLFYVSHNLVIKASSHLGSYVSQMFDASSKTRVIYPIFHWKVFDEAFLKVCCCSDPSSILRCFDKTSFLADACPSNLLSAISFRHVDVASSGHYFTHFDQDYCSSGFFFYKLTFIFLSNILVNLIRFLSLI